MPKHNKLKYSKVPVWRSKASTGIRGEGPKPSSTSYSGPVRVHSKSEQLELVNFASFSTLVSTSASSTFSTNTVFTAGSVTSTTDWSAYAGLYQECRCVGIQVKFLPSFQNSNLSYNTQSGTSSFGPTYASPLFLCKYHADATALASEDAAVNHMSRNEQPVNHPSDVVSVKMKESEEASWSKTSSPTIGVFGVKTYFQGITLGSTESIVWGSFIVTYAVQFRLRTVGSTAFLRPSLSICTSSVSKQKVPQDEKEKLEKVEHKAPTKTNKNLPQIQPEQKHKNLSRSTHEVDLSPNDSSDEYEMPRLLIASHKTYRKEPPSPGVPYPVKITDRSS
jgi:hypothetical protein